MVDASAHSNIPSSAAIGTPQERFYASPEIKYVPWMRVSEEKEGEGTGVRLFAAAQLTMCAECAALGLVGGLWRISENRGNLYAYGLWRRRNF